MKIAAITAREKRERLDHFGSLRERWCYEFDITIAVMAEPGDEPVDPRQLLEQTPQAELGASLLLGAISPGDAVSEVGRIFLGTEGKGDPLTARIKDLEEANAYLLGELRREQRSNQALYDQWHELHASRNGP